MPLHFSLLPPLHFSSKKFSCPFSMGQCWTKLCGGNVTDTKEQCPVRELAGGNVHLITTMKQWEEKISEANRDSKTVVVNFSASWCSPCRNIVPTYIELADRYPSTIFLTVEVDELAELSNSWDVKATPTFFFLKNGKEMDKLVGANKPELQKKLMAFAGSI